jgi:hypothetical protein
MTGRYPNILLSLGERVAFRIIKALRNHDASYSAFNQAFKPRTPRMGVFFSALVALGAHM